MIGYHYSPIRNYESIAKHGLLVPTKHPKLVTPQVCSEGHRNPHISLGRTAAGAWELSGGFLYDRHRKAGTVHRMRKAWNLYEVDLTGIRYSANRGFDEITVRTDIPRRNVRLIGTRLVAGPAALSKLFVD